MRGWRCERLGVWECERLGVSLSESTYCLLCSTGSLTSFCILERRAAQHNTQATTVVDKLRVRNLVVAGNWFLA